MSKNHEHDYWKSPRIVLDEPVKVGRPPQPTSLEPPSWVIREAKAVKAERRMSTIYFTCMVIYAVIVGIYSAMVAFGD